ncbi:MAG: hypothetical protein ACUVQH_11020, partial [Thermogutta sp.]
YETRLRRGCGRPYLRHSPNLDGEHFSHLKTICIPQTPFPLAGAGGRAAGENSEASHTDLWSATACCRFIVECDRLQSLSLSDSLLSLDRSIQSSRCDS